MIKNNKQKCAFIYVNQGFAVRYLLRTEIFHTLKNNISKIVILSHNGDESIFKNAFESDNVIVEKVDTDNYQEYLKQTKFQRLLIQLRAYVLNGKYDTRTTDDFRHIFICQQKWTKLYGFMNWIKGILWNTVSNLLKYNKLFRKLLIGFETRFFSPNPHQHLFKKYKPDLVILSALCGFKYNEFFAREAILNNVPVCTVILSWDNTSGMGMPGYNPDYVIAWSKNMKRELIELNDIEPRKIFIGGVAHFDSYYDDSHLLKKRTLYEKLDLDLSKKTIFYATKSPRRFPWGPELLKEIADLIKNGKIEKDTQILVRVHPLHFRSNNGIHKFQQIVEKYTDIGQKYDNVIINIPQRSSKKMDFDLAESETKLVSSILKHSDVMINMFSTMVLEASIFQLPSINICIREKCKADLGMSRQDIMVDYVQTHNQRVIKTHGVKTVFNMEELCDAINLYLTSPNSDNEKRKTIVENEIGPNPGEAGRAIGTYIAGLLH